MVARPEGPSDLAAGPHLVGDLVVDVPFARAGLAAAADLALLLRHEEDLVLLEEPVVGAPLAAVVERGLLALRREHALLLEDVEELAVLGLEDVVDDAV